MIDESVVAEQMRLEAAIKAVRVKLGIPENWQRVTFCEDCYHWNRENQRIDICGNPTACCRWFTRQGNYIETSRRDYCSYGCYKTNDSCTVS